MFRIASGIAAKHESYVCLGSNVYRMFIECLSIELDSIRIRVDGLNLIELDEADIRTLLAIKRMGLGFLTVYPEKFE